jgi:hypothetical protein
LSGRPASRWKVARTVPPLAPFDSMNVVDYALDRSRNKGLAFWLLDGPRAVTRTDFMTNWLDLDYWIRTYIPTERVAYSVQLYVNRRTDFVLRYFKSSAKKGSAEPFVLTRRLRRVGIAEVDFFKRFVEGVASSRPTCATPPGGTATSPASIPIVNIRMEMSSELGLERYGFMAPIADHTGQGADIDLFWKTYCAGNEDDAFSKSIIERYSIDPFGDALDLNYDDFARISDELDLGLSLVSRISVTSKPRRS